MGNRWQAIPLEDCATWYSGGTPSKKNQDYWNGSIPWISAKSLNGFFISDSEDKVTSAALGKGTRLVPKHTILFVVRGMSLKKEFRLGITGRPVTFNQDIKALVPRNEIDPYFLVYAIKAKSEEILTLVEEAGHGTGVLPTKIMQSLIVRVPSLHKQKKISSFFHAIDDKIELNRRMNETLESMAQALFKSWFVDFDPVIDNALAAGNDIPEALQERAAARQALGDKRKPLPEEIRKLFPSSFEFSDELGWLPQGWKMMPVSECINVNPKTQLKKGQVAKCVDMKGLPTSGYAISATYEKAYSGGAKFINGDVLLARITPCLENGKTGIVDFLDEGEVGFGSTEFIVLRRKGSLKTPFIACLSKDEKFRNHCVQSMVGSSGRQRVQNSSFDSYYLTLPNINALCEVFDDRLCSKFYKMTAIKREMGVLATLRDTLLPRLLSGELRIPDAEQLIEEAV